MHVRSRITLAAAAAAAVVALASCGGSGGPGAGADLKAAPVASQAQVASRSFIVVLKGGVSNPGTAARSLMAGQPGQVGFVYTTAIKGFSVSVPEAAVDAFLSAMERSGIVDLVEEDQPFSANATVTETGATWGIDRTDQRDLPLSGSYSYDATGAGVTAYIIDTGILASHAEFAIPSGGSRATTDGYTAITDGNGTNDCNGHGTHVSGTVGGTTYGMAKGVNLVPVRVLDCNGSGTTSGVIAGVDWVASHAAKPAVANMSLGGGASSSLDTAVANLVASGVTLAVAAGNSNKDACNYSPARAPSAITVGATTSTDARASYSNYGTCLDVFAPGSSITSAWNTSTTATNTISGTSMATPHVTGLAALLLEKTPTALPSDIDAAIKQAATTGKVTSPGTGSPNRLIYTGATATVTPPPSPIVAKVTGIAGSTTLYRNAWTATATPTVVDASAGTPVAGAVVTGSFSVGGSGLSCTTNTAGQCGITSGGISKGTTSTTFTLSNVTGAGVTSLDGSSVTTTTILKP